MQVQSQKNLRFIPTNPHGGAGLGVRVSGFAVKNAETNLLLRIFLLHTTSTYGEDKRY